jgi:hypothetical protein
LIGFVVGNITFIDDDIIAHRRYIARLSTTTYKDYRTASGGSRQPSRPHFKYLSQKKRTVFNKRVRPHSACALLKTTSDGASAEPFPINA